MRARVTFRVSTSIPHYFGSRFTLVSPQRLEVNFDGSCSFYTLNSVRGESILAATTHTLIQSTHSGLAAAHQMATTLGM